MSLMKLSLALCITGLSLIGVGLALVFASMGGGVFLQASVAGIALFLLGLFTVIASVVAYAVRRPTPEELASQKPGKYGTWHFRPIGLLIVGIEMVGALLLGDWVERELPVIKDALDWVVRNVFGLKPRPYVVAGCICVILALVSVSFRRIRNLIFYTGQLPAANAGDKGGQEQKKNKRGRGESAGINRHGVADERAAQERSSEPT